MTKENKHYHIIITRGGGAIDFHGERLLALLLQFELDGLACRNRRALRNDNLEPGVRLHANVVGKKVDVHQGLQILHGIAHPGCALELTTSSQRHLNCRSVHDHALVRVVVWVINGQKVGEELGVKWAEEANRITEGPLDVVVHVVAIRDSSGNENVVEGILVDFVLLEESL